LEELKKAFIPDYMIVYRIVKNKKRANDFSGRGASNEGGRWNNPGVFALYTSESRALAMLEVLVHVEESELPPDMHIITIEIDEKAPIYEVPDNDLPKDWREPENIALKNTGDALLESKKYLTIKVRSAVMPNEYNLILNPLFPRYYDLVKMIKIDLLNVDERLK